jgi:hypothetical protein
VNRFTLAFLIKSAETLRAQPIPLFLVRLLVDPNWHRGATLTTFGYTWLHKTMHNRKIVNKVASQGQLDYVCLRLDIDIAFRSG